MLDQVEKIKVNFFGEQNFVKFFWESFVDELNLIKCLI